jgi:TetR/AcrR family transcriptional regulator, transcriptional repressor for nem operon
MGSREKVLDAATTIFGKVGYQAASVDDILEAAKVAPSNFYYHFKSKQELALEVLEGYFERSRQEIAPILMNRSIPASKKLERLHAAYIQKIKESGCCGGCPMGNLAQELSDTHPDFRKKLAQYFEECVDGLAGVIREGIEAGEFNRDVDPRGAAFLILGSLQGLTLLAKTMKRVEPVEAGFAQTLRLLKE